MKSTKKYTDMLTSAKGSLTSYVEAVSGRIGEKGDININLKELDKIAGKGDGASTLKDVVQKNVDLVQAKKAYEGVAQELIAVPATGAISTQKIDAITSATSQAGTSITASPATVDPYVAQQGTALMQPAHDSLTAAAKDVGTMRATQTGALDYFGKVIRAPLPATPTTE